MTVTGSNSSYEQYYAPGASLVVQGDETGVCGIKDGKIGIWGEGTSKEQPKEDDKPGEKEKNPDSGMNAATGIASGLAIAALAVAAAACLKKND